MGVSITAGCERGAVANWIQEVTNTSLREGEVIPVLKQALVHKHWLAFLIPFLSQSKEIREIKEEEQK